MKTKRFIAILVSLLICLSALFCVPVSAADGAVPIISVHGIMTVSICENPGTDAQRTIFPPATEDITEAVKQAVPEIMKFLVTRDWNALLDTVTPTFTDILGDTYCDNNGDVKPNTGVSWQYPDRETVRASAQTGFEYDWRLSPLEAAEQLHDYIEYVRECTGSAKVALKCHSLGNCVGLSYVALYGTGALAGFFCDSSAFLGVGYNGELMCGNIAIEADALCDFLKDNMFAGTEYEQAGYALLEALDLLCVTNAVEANISYAMDKVIDRLTKEVLLQWLGKCPSIWAVVPDGDYENARSHVFDTVLADEDCTGLLTKLDAYDAAVRERRGEILDAVSALNFGVVARYNKQKIPVTDNPTALTDSTIDVKYSSFGATAAEYKSTLPAGYTQARYNDVNYISPDNMIDASACMFPERTWFIRGMGHSEGSDDLDELCRLVLSTEGFKVTSDERFPQFLAYDNITDTLMPLEDYSAPGNSLLVKFLALLQRIKEFILKPFRDFSSKVGC